MKAHGWRRVIAGMLVLAGLAVGWGILAADVAAGPPPAFISALVSATPEPPRRELQGNVEVSAISAIDSPSPTCSRPVAGTGRCYIQWSYLSVAASSPGSIISMTVTIDGRLRAYHAGFFQASMYIDGQVYGPGFRVTCGLPVGDGSTGLGNTYNFSILARESGGSMAANYGSVTCPADVVHVNLPLVQKH